MHLKAAFETSSRDGNKGWPPADAKEASRESTGLLDLSVDCITEVQYTAKEADGPPFSKNSVANPGNKC
jgi:hypothetical protein